MPSEAASQKTQSGGAHWRRLADPFYLLINVNHGSRLLLLPLLSIYKKIKRHQKKASPDLSLRRWKCAPITPELTKTLLERPGPHVVFAAISVGEAALIERAAQALQEARPDVKLTYCIRDARASKAFRDQHPDTPMAEWPYDFFIPVGRFLDQQKPDLLVFSDAYTSKALVVGAALQGVKVAVLNGRPTVPMQSKARWKRWYYRQVFRYYRAIYPANQEVADYMKAFLGESTDMRVIGDLKFDLRRTSIAPEKGESLENWLSQRGEAPLVAAGNTDDMLEDRMVLEAFKKLREAHDCRLLLAPRRMQFIPNALEIAAELGLSVSSRTKSGEDADVYLLDTFGELAYAYRFAVAAYVGGSYRGKGHNVSEPLEWGVPISYGMQRGVFRSMQLACEAAGASVRVADSGELLEFWKGMLEDPEARSDMGRKGKELLRSQRGAVDRVVQALSELLDAPANAEVLWRRNSAQGRKSAAPGL